MNLKIKILAFLIMLFPDSSVADSYSTQPSVRSLHDAGEHLILAVHSRVRGLRLPSSIPGAKGQGINGYGINNPNWLCDSAHSCRGRHQLIFRMTAISPPA